MQTRNLRLLIIVASIIIVSIITIQLVWIVKLSTYEEKEFNFKVINAIDGLVDHLNPQNSGNSLSLAQEVDRPDENTYLVKIKTIPKEEKLKLFYAKELEKVDLFIDCRIAAYDAVKKDFVYFSYIKGPGSVMLKKNLSEISIYDRDYNYVFINFPNRNQYILQKLNQWIISTALLILTLTGLLAMLIYIMRERYIMNFQKDFVNNLVHEFRTPLSVMKIAADVLVKDNILQQPERLKNYASIVNDQTDHLQGQVQKLLEVTTSGGKDIFIKKENFSLSDVIEKAIAKLQPLIDEKKAVLELQLEDECKYTGDKGHLELAIVNLIENAIKYSEHPHVIVSCGKEGNDFFIRVKDNGIGIEKKYVANLFKKFYRVPTGDVHNVKGFGLGLNFVKKVVDGHKGKIHVTSLPGIGTEFRMVLPA